LHPRSEGALLIHLVFCPAYLLVEGEREELEKSLIEVIERVQKFLDLVFREVDRGLKGDLLLEFGGGF